MTRRPLTSPEREAVHDHLQGRALPFKQGCMGCGDDTYEIGSLTLLPDAGSEAEPGLAFIDVVCACCGRTALIEASTVGLDVD
jgi:hypothetical protein